MHLPGCVGESGSDPERHPCSAWRLIDAKIGVRVALIGGFQGLTLLRPFSCPSLARFSTRLVLGRHALGGVRGKFF